MSENSWIISHRSQTNAMRKFLIGDDNVVAPKTPYTSKMSAKRDKNGRDLHRIYLPVVVSQSGWITKTFGEWIRINFQFGNQLILIRCDGGEYGFGKDERLVIDIMQFGWRRRYTLARCQTHQMDSRLISMHRIENNLKKNRTEKCENSQSKTHKSHRAATVDT